MSRKVQRLGARLRFAFDRSEVVSLTIAVVLVIATLEIGFLLL
jgi:hypothetical protein